MSLRSARPSAASLSLVSGAKSFIAVLLVGCIDRATLAVCIMAICGQMLSDETFKSRRFHSRRPSSARSSADSELRMKRYHHQGSREVSSQCIGRPRCILNPCSPSPSICTANPLLCTEFTGMHRFSAFVAQSQRQCRHHTCVVIRVIGLHGASTATFVYLRASTAGGINSLVRTACPRAARMHRQCPALVGRVSGSDRAMLQSDQAAKEPRAINSSSSASSSAWSLHQRRAAGM